MKLVEIMSPDHYEDMVWEMIRLKDRSKENRKKVEIKYLERDLYYWKLWFDTNLNDMGIKRAEMFANHILQLKEVLEERK